MDSNSGDSSSSKRKDPFSWILPTNHTPTKDDDLDNLEEEDILEEPISTNRNNFENWFMPKQRQQASTDNQKRSPITLFGKRQQEEVKDANWLDNINVMEMMEHADTLIATFSELKPLFKKIPTLLATFKKK